jgi:hypothetical protein
MVPAQSVSGSGASSKPTGSSASGSSAATATPAADLRVVFGVKEGSPVKSGFLFIDGAYVEAPYVVSRRGGTVLVNNRQVKVLVTTWPSPLVVDTDPGTPPGLTKDSSFNDLDFPDRPGDSWDRKKRRWLTSHLPPEEAKSRIIEYYRSLPFVKSAEIEKSGSLRVVTHSGEEELIGMHLMFRPETTEHVTQRIEEERLRLEADLKSGACIFAFSNGGEVLLAKRQAAEDLGLIAEIIGSERKADEKILLLQRMDVPIPPIVNEPKWLTLMVSGFKASDDLTKRLKDLVAETGVTPRELKDVPAEGRIQRERRRIAEQEMKERKAAKASASGSAGGSGH